MPAEKTIHPETGMDDNTDDIKTGPNVDNGYVAGHVTVDPDTAAGRAAKATRDANDSTETQHDNGVIEVTHGALGDTTAEKVKVAQATDPTTIANKKGDVVADPKADVQ